MTQASPSQTLTKLAQAARDCAATKAWDQISLRELCEHASVTLADCAAENITKAHIAAHLDQDLDQNMLAAAREFDRTASVRDRLFDVMMARFDAMEDNRAAWYSILSGETSDPLARLARQGRRARAAAWALEAAGVTASDLRGAGRTIGLARILRLVESVWRDDGPDLAKTMARLDQELRQGEELLARTSDLRAFFSGFGFGKPKATQTNDAVTD
jgi:hypothetical protein